MPRTHEAVEGWTGWDEYAPFYDWENARTLGRRDVAFWRQVALRARGPVLELGCGTGRISLPLARAGVSIVGVDRSAPMLAQAARRARGLAQAARSARGLVQAARRARGLAQAARGARGLAGRGRGSIRLVRSDIRALPFASARFATVLAPYGILQSLLRERDLSASLAAVARVLRPGGLFGIDLVPDVPRWREYSDKVQLTGRARGGVDLTLRESVRQQPRRRLTIFEQVYVARRRDRVTTHRFTLTFRTLSIRQMASRLERSGFAIEALVGDYCGAPWDTRADAWIILARRVG